MQLTLGFLLGVFLLVAVGQCSGRRRAQEKIRKTKHRALSRQTNEGILGLPDDGRLTNPQYYNLNLAQVNGIISKFEELAQQTDPLSAVDPLRNWLVKKYQEYQMGFDVLVGDWITDTLVQIDDDSWYLRYQDPKLGNATLLFLGIMEERGQEAPAPKTAEIPGTINLTYGGYSSDDVSVIVTTVRTIVQQRTSDEPLRGCFTDIEAFMYESGYFHVPYSKLVSFSTATAPPFRASQTDASYYLSYYDLETNIIFRTTERYDGL